ncbi:hypothetical protein KY284_001945 [Solanum tuberosum]|nr:hypothetical protein KY284_001945 [Solanum tuberosum]
MDILATSHVDQNDVYLWVNQAMFSGAASFASYGSGKEIVNVKMAPSAASEKDGEKSNNRTIFKPSESSDTSQFLNSSHQIPDLATFHFCLRVNGRA